MTNRNLLRELGWVVVLKLVLIMLLWSAFVRDARVTVDDAAMAERARAEAVKTTLPREGTDDGH